MREGRDTQESTPQVEGRESWIDRAVAPIQRKKESWRGRSIHQQIKEMAWYKETMEL